MKKIVEIQRPKRCNLAECRWSNGSHSATCDLLQAKKDGETIIHHARIITYVDEKKRKLMQLLTNDMDSDPDEIIAIYRQRWEIELQFKQIKQNFPLKYFYGESANAIKIQIWMTLIANLLLMVMQRGLTRSWSFSGLATMVRINLMYYVDFYSLFNHPEKDWEVILEATSDEPPQPTLFDWGGIVKNYISRLDRCKSAAESHVLIIFGFNRTAIYPL